MNILKCKWTKKIKSCCLAQPFRLSRCEFLKNISDDTEMCVPNYFLQFVACNGIWIWVDGKCNDKN
jgi:hypothetical protein